MLYDEAKLANVDLKDGIRRSPCGQTPLFLRWDGCVENDKELEAVIDFLNVRVQQALLGIDGLELNSLEKFAMRVLYGHYNCTVQTITAPHRPTPPEDEPKP